MHEFILLILGAALMLSAKYFYYIAQKLGPQKYKQHIIFEGMPSVAQEPDLRFHKIISITDVLFFGMLALYIFQKDPFQKYYTWQMFAGFIVIFYAFILGSSLANALVYKYAIQHPDQISGQTHLKLGIVEIIKKAIVLQLIIPSIALAFMLPSPYIYGALVGLSWLLLVTFKKLPIF